MKSWISLAKLKICPDRIRSVSRSIELADSESRLNQSPLFADQKCEDIHSQIISLVSKLS
jgi:hypothetical protein